MPDPIKQLVDSRNSEYKDAWRTTGEFLQQFGEPLLRLLKDFPALWFPLVMVFNKAIRLLGHPVHLDGWKDIQGYAQLAIDYLEKEEETK